MIEERDLTGARLAEVVATLLDDRPRLTAMRQAMRALARPDAAARIVARLRALAA
jgi:UDP-N-acetylglucosamine:LPS N-acetylglucosamine transferase